MAIFTMGKEDIKLKTYLEDTRVYADLWNGSAFNGRQMLKPEELWIVSPILTNASGGQALEKTQDLVMMQSNTGQCFAVYTVENQENIDYSMPARIMIQEYPLHFLDLTEIKHFERFQTELGPLLYQKRNHKEEFIEYLRDERKYINMDDESWYLLCSLTHSKGIKELVREKLQKMERQNISLIY